MIKSRPGFTGFLPIAPGVMKLKNNFTESVNSVMPNDQVCSGDKNTLLQDAHQIAITSRIHLYIARFAMVYHAKPLIVLEVSLSPMIVKKNSNNGV